MYFCIAFCAAIIFSGFQSQLLPVYLCQFFLALAGFLVLLYWRYRRFGNLVAIAAGILLGLAYVNWMAGQRMQQQLPDTFEQEDIEIEAIIASLPVDKGRYQQYAVDVFKAPAWPAHDVLLKTLLLNDYQSQAMHPCDKWQLTVRLKRPHGLGNPAGFDYEAYLLEQGVQARGYVRKAKLLAANEGFCLHGVRQRWSDYVLSRVPKEKAAWIVALSTGDKSLLNEEQNLLLQETGTTHLFVISGSHIALCALAVYALLMFVRRLGAGYFFRGDWRPLVALAALLVAGIYTALAGYGVPSQRSLIMLTVFLGTQVIGLQVSLWLRYWLSMLAVLLLNPLSALNVGFVLSFGAVFILILLAESMSSQEPDASRLQRALLAVKELFWAQLVIFIGLLPFTLLYFAQISLLAPLLNFIAVPAMSFIILPTILSALLGWCVMGVDVGLLDFAVYQLDVLFQLIDNANRFFKMRLSTFPAVAMNNTMIVVLLLACLLMLLPRVLKTWPIGLLLLLAVFASEPRQPLPENSVVIDVIDVDQGLSVLIQTARHQLLVDTGSAWPEGSMVERAVKPYLLQQGIRELDKVIISHLDNDHAGGIHDLLESFTVKEVSSSEPVDGIDTVACKTGQQWRWDGVDFRVLHPDEAGKYWKRNNKSCVLLIEVAGRRILLPGDVEERIEQELVRHVPKIDVMVAPHHGSKTSSTEAWVAKVANGIVVFPSGYLSQFGHPHPLVEQRYQAANVQAFNSGLHGLVSIRVDASGNVKASSWRQEKGRFWHKIRRIDNHS